MCFAYLYVTALGFDVNMLLCFGLWLRNGHVSTKVPNLPVCARLLIQRL